MKALREAVEVSRRAQELTDAQASLGGEAPSANGTGSANGKRRRARSSAPPAASSRAWSRSRSARFDDFSQLVGFEDAAGQIDATAEISVERFSEGRATLSMRLDEPVDLLRELEERSPLEFRVRHTADDNLILDVDEDPGPEQHAA